ncbi:PKD domain-containing protein [Halobacteriales archaeon Cl-PHB]
MGVNTHLRVNRLISLGVVVCLLGGIGVVAANEAPMANAGLDQDVQQGDWVYLDASGSFDPDGDLAAYNWRIETPNGTVIAPGCQDCAQTSFQVHQSGKYKVTVTVTDDEGANAADTMYVDVDAVQTPTPTPSRASQPRAPSSTGGSLDEFVQYQAETGEIVIHTDNPGDIRPHFFTNTEEGRDYMFSTDAWESIMEQPSTTIKDGKVILDGAQAQAIRDDLSDSPHTSTGNTWRFGSGTVTRDELTNSCNDWARCSAQGLEKRRTISEPTNSGSNAGGNEQYTSNPNWNDIGGDDGDYNSPSTGSSQENSGVNSGSNPIDSPGFRW